MAKKISLQFGGRRFDVDVDDTFARFLQQQIADDFNTEGNNDIKLLLQAYIRKTHELYSAEKQIEEIIKSLS